MKTPLFSLIVAGFFCSSTAMSSTELQNFFEWGEYQQLIDSLEPQIVAMPCAFDSLRCAQYHCFLGVAYFGKGRIGDAQTQFRQALSYRKDVQPDSNYLPVELNGLFIATRADFLDKLSRAHEKDSLFLAEKEALSANVRAIQQEEAHRSRRAGLLLAVSFFTLSAATAAAAAYEYLDTRQPYDEFSAAAHEGDKAAYDRLRPEIRLANSIITGCTATAVVFMGTSITFTVRLLRKKQ